MTETLARARLTRSGRVRVVCSVKAPLKAKLEQLAEANGDTLSGYVAHILSQHTGMQS